MLGAFPANNKKPFNLNFVQSCNCRLSELQTEARDSTDLSTLILQLYENYFSNIFFHLDKGGLLFPDILMHACIFECHFCCVLLFSVLYNIWYYKHWVWVWIINCHRQHSAYKCDKFGCLGIPIYENPPTYCLNSIKQKRPILDLDIDTNKMLHLMCAYSL